MRVVIHNHVHVRDSDVPVYRWRMGVENQRVIPSHAAASPFGGEQPMGGKPFRMEKIAEAMRILRP